MLAAFTIGAIPLIFGLFIVENNALKRNLLEAQKLNKALSERHKDEKGSNEMITLSGETKRLRHPVAPKYFLYGSIWELCRYLL